jgi:cold shock CspA family protein
MEGTVVQWFELRGFGFIKVDGSKDIFFHISSVKNKDDVQRLEKGRP